MAEGKPDNSTADQLPKTALVQANGRLIQPFSFIRCLPATGDVTSAVILVHGMTHNAATMMRWSRNEIRTVEPQMALYALDAPYFADPNQHRLAARPRGREKSRVWYELPSRFHPREDLRQQLTVGVSYVHRMIDHIKDTHDLDESRIHILAFSQGCAVALQAALEREQPVASVALLAGFAYDPALFNLAKPRSRPPIFYGMIGRDDTVPRAMYLHTATFMREYDLPVTVHSTPSVRTEHHVSLRGLFRSVALHTPSHLRMYLARKDRDDPGYQPPGPHDIGRPHSVVRFADDGFGNLAFAGIDTTLRVTAHWVNPPMRDALLLWHTRRTLSPDMGMTPIDQLRLPRVTMKMLERGWMASPEKLDASKPEVLPEWMHPHLRFNSLAAHIRHRFFNAAVWATTQLLRPFKRFVYLAPDPRGRLLHSRIHLRPEIIRQLPHHH